MQLLIEQLKFVKGLDPVADAFDNGATPASDVVSMRGYGNVLFLIHIGVGVTGTQTLTVEACDNVTPSNTTTIVFWYREILSGDTEGALTKATASGFTVTAGSSKIILVEARAQDVVEASVNSIVGNEFVRLKQSAEPSDSPVLGGISIIMGGKPSRYTSDSKPTVIV